MRSRSSCSPRSVSSWRRVDCTASCRSLLRSGVESWVSAWRSAHGGTMSCSWSSGRDWCLLPSGPTGGTHRSRHHPAQRMRGLPDAVIATASAASSQATPHRERQWLLVKFSRTRRGSRRCGSRSSMRPGRDKWPPWLREWTVRLDRDEMRAEGALTLATTVLRLWATTLRRCRNRHRGKRWDASWNR